MERKKDTMGEGGVGEKKAKEKRREKVKDKVMVSISFP